MQRITFLLITLIGYWLIGTSVVASSQDKNTKETIPFIYATYSAQLPGGDLSKKFGFSNDIGGGTGMKTKNNWMLAAEATYTFGQNVKENPILIITNSDGTLTDIYGEEATLLFWQRGYQIKITFGKIFPVLNSNNNSGIYLKGSIGYLQHKTWIENRNNNTPQIQGDYQQGYDRLCNGLAFSEFIGWQNWSETKGYNFFVGFEFTQGFTKNRRTWDFSTNSKIEEQRLDLIYAIKIGWYIPFKRKQSATKYYFY
jgi:hypothetical protein